MVIKATNIMTPERIAKMSTTGVMRSYGGFLKLMENNEEAKNSGPIKQSVANLNSSLKKNKEEVRRILDRNIKFYEGEKEKFDDPNYSRRKEDLESIIHAGKDILGE